MKKIAGTNTFSPPFPFKEGEGEHVNILTKTQKKQAAKSGFLKFLLEILEVLVKWVLRGVLPFLWVFRYIKFLGMGKFIIGACSPYQLNKEKNQFLAFFTIMTIVIFGYLYFVGYYVNDKPFPFVVDYNLSTIQFILGLVFVISFFQKYRKQLRQNKLSKKFIPIISLITFLYFTPTIIFWVWDIPDKIQFGESGSPSGQYQFLLLYFGLLNLVINFYCNLKFQIPDFTALTFSSKELSFNQIKTSTPSHLLLGVTGKTQYQIPLYSPTQQKQIMIAGDINSGANRYFSDYLPYACSFTPNLIIIFCDSSRRSGQDFSPYYRYHYTELQRLLKESKYDRRAKFERLRQIALSQNYPKQSKFKRLYQEWKVPYKTYDWLNTTTAMNLPDENTYSQIPSAAGIVVADSPAHVAHILTNIHRHYFLKAANQRGIPQKQNIQFAIFLDDVTVAHLIYKIGIYDKLCNIPFTRMLKDGKGYGIHLFLRMPPNKKPSTIPNDALPYLDCISFWYRHKAENQNGKEQMPPEDSPVLTYNGIPIGEFTDVFHYHNNNTDWRLKAPVINPFLGNQIIQTNFLQNCTQGSVIADWVKRLTDKTAIANIQEDMPETQSRYVESQDGTLTLDRTALTAEQKQTWDE